jgi:2-polyprenyl-3-methyl-5-hydroxy-6-metoxy-1,4-benzoquinol methylase
MENSQIKWKDLEKAYFIRSSKYEGGKYMSITRKHEGVMEYLTEAIGRIGSQEIGFCDAGCGNGIYLKLLKDRFDKIRLDGFDFSAKIVEIAKKNTGLENLRLGNLEEPIYGDGKFDLVLCTQVIEHLLDDKKGMDELNRILKKGGYLVISTDNKNNSVTKILNFPANLILFPYRLVRKAFKGKREEYFPHKDYLIDEFNGLIKGSGFSIESISTFRFSFSYPLNKLQFLVDMLDRLERKIIANRIFKNKGDIVIALCKKQ